MIIGTAGHVDHGKTELIKALTGVDTDRLREEKERGISIDLGFAPFHLPSGRLLGVVDVPGHEKFIHNMLAGIGGIDLVLLVIDATEGVMPQTREHLEIMGLLQIKKGFLVVTKVDLVDEELLELVIEDIREGVRGTFLEDAPLHTVSSVTGVGIDGLRNEIDEIAGTVADRDRDAPLRIPLDRAFSVAGFGSVVTGTLLSGSVEVGQTVEVLPPGRQYRVRGVQVHGESVERAYAGQRVALNLAGLEKREVLRGSVVATPDFFQMTRFCDARLKLLSSSPRPLANMAPVHFYLGTARVVARLMLLDREEILPGEDGFVQCRLDRPLVAKRGDRFIIRSYSPVITIGGGTVLDERPPRHKRLRKEVQERLQEMEKEDPLPFILHKLESAGGANMQELLRLTNMGTARLQELLDGAVEQGKVVAVAGYYIPARTWEDWQSGILERLENFHRENPLRPGIQRAQLNEVLPRSMAGKVYDSLLEQLKEQGKINLSGGLVSGKDFSQQPSAEQGKKLASILEAFQKGGLAPPAPKELWPKLNIRKEEGEELLEYLHYRGMLVKVSEGIYLHRDTYDKCLEMLRDYFQKNRSITLSQYRDLLGSSRKYAQALLEHFDGCKYTRRVGDERVPWKIMRG